MIPISVRRMSLLYGVSERGIEIAQAGTSTAGGGLATVGSASLEPHFVPQVDAYLTYLCGPPAADQLTGQVIADLIAAEEASGRPADADTVIDAARRAGLAWLARDARRPGRRLSRRGCYKTPVLLAERTGGRISPRDVGRLYHHLATCEDCASVAARYDAAEWNFWRDLAALSVGGEGARSAAAATGEPALTTAPSNGATAAEKPAGGQTGAAVRGLTGDPATGAAAQTELAAELAEADAVEVDLAGVAEAARTSVASELAQEPTARTALAADLAEPSEGEPRGAGEQARRRGTAGERELAAELADRPERAESVRAESGRADRAQEALNAAEAAPSAQVALENAGGTARATQAVRLADAEGQAQATAASVDEAETAREVLRIEPAGAAQPGRRALAAELADAAHTAGEALATELAERVTRTESARALSVEAQRAQQALDLATTAAAARAAQTAELDAADEQARAELAAELQRKATAARNALTAELAQAAETRRRALAAELAKTAQTAEQALAAELAEARRLVAREVTVAAEPAAGVWAQATAEAQARQTAGLARRELTPAVEPGELQPEASPAAAGMGRSAALVFLVVLIRKYVYRRPDGDGAGG